MYIPVCLCRSDNACYMLWPQVASIEGFQSREGIYTVKKFNGIDGACCALWQVGVLGKVAKMNNEDTCVHVSLLSQYFYDQAIRERHVKTN